MTHQMDMDNKAGASKKSAGNTNMRAVEGIVVTWAAGDVPVGSPISRLLGGF